MIDAKDPVTVAMPLEVKRGRGRPRKADALTPAQRAAAYRARHADKRDVTKSPAVYVGKDEVQRVYERGYCDGVSEVDYLVAKLFDHMDLMRLRKKPQTVAQLKAYFAGLRKA